MYKWSYSYMVIDFTEIESDISGAFAFFKDCGYAGVELNLTPQVLSRLDELEVAARDHELVIPSMLTGAPSATCSGTAVPVTSSTVGMMSIRWLTDFTSRPWSLMPTGQ